MDDPQKPQRVTQWQALGFVWDLLFAIALPVIFFALGGRYLDSRYHLSPLFTILGLFFALGLTSVLVSRKAKEIRRLFLK